MVRAGPLVTGAAVVLVLAACGKATMSGHQESTGTSSTTDASSATRSRPYSTFARLPSVGAVVIRHGSYGLVIVDRATGGKRFVLAGAQAGECLSYLRANPNATAADVRTACPGSAGTHG
jgi:hypothetical protein